MKEEQLKVALAIQQCYELLFRQRPIDTDCKNDRAEYSIDLDCFKVYSNLVKNGFIVRRAEKFSKNRSSICSMSAKKDKETSTTSSPPKKSTTKIKPIVDRSDHERLSQHEIYARLNRLIPSVTLDELKNRLDDDEEDDDESRPRHLFEVNQPDKRFQKSKPSKPDFRVFAAKVNTNRELRVPDLVDFIANSSAAKTQIYAFTDDSNQPIYYSFDFDFSIPSIVQD